MRLSQDRLVLAAHVIAESAWVFALAGVIGVMGSLDSSPQSWYAIIGILGLTVVISRMTPRHGDVAELIYFLVAILGLVVVYASVSLQVIPGQIRLGWPIDWVAGEVPDEYTFRAVFGAMLAFALWWRGIRLASNEYPTDNLSQTFRVGMVVLVAALIYDLNQDESLYTFPMIFLFFASSLVGLSVGHLLPESERSAEGRTWQKVIGATVAAITIFGLVVGLINRGVLALLSAPATTALEALARGIFWAIVAPIAFAFDVIVRWIINTLGLFQDRGVQREEGEFNTEIQNALQELQEEQEAASESFGYIIQIIEWVLLAIVVLIVALVLARAFRRLLRGRPGNTRGRRDSLAEDADLTADVAKLLLNLVPNVLKRPRQKGYQVPDGPPGIVEAFRLYYDMLDTAEKHGISRRKHDTPSEFQGRLERAFPSSVVGPSTEVFNLAIYANIPAERSLIHRLRQSLKTVTAAIARERKEEEDWK